MKISRNNINYLTCGIFNSNSWGIPKAYRIYPDKIECDSSRSYFSKRFTIEGYQFKGEPFTSSKEDLIIITEIFNKVPDKCFTLDLPLPNTPGNKDENTIYIEIALVDATSTEFKIDEYDERDLQIDNDVLVFKDAIKETIKLIETKSNE